MRGVEKTGKKIAETQRFSKTFNAPCADDALIQYNIGRDLHEGNSAAYPSLLCGTPELNWILH